MYQISLKHNGLKHQALTISHTFRGSGIQEQPNRLSVSHEAVVGMMTGSAASSSREALKAMKLGQSINRKQDQD